MHNTAIVIGATGLVGTEVVKQLATAKHINKVRALNRRAIEYQHSKIENHIVDFENLDNHAELFTGEFLFSCLGTTAKQAGSIKAQRVVDVDYQLAAARLAANNGVAHYLLVSSSGANSRSFNPYLRMKGELEKEISELPFTRISIFQPSLLLGNRSDSRLGEDLASIAMPMVCKLPGLRRYRPIQAAQVAAKMLAVSAQPTADKVLERFTLDKVFPDS